MLRNVVVMHVRRLAVALVLLMPGIGVAKPSVLLELFTSQGCSSCPAASELLSQRYLDQDDVLALEFHVDYWDTLVHGGSSWRDPFSSRDYTDRQVSYSTTTLRNPFTPQIIIQGSYSASGANRQSIDHAIDEVRKLNLTTGWEIEFEQQGDTWTANVKQSAGEIQAFAVTYLHKATTFIKGGENKDKTLDNHNIVLALRQLGPVSSGSKVDMGLPGVGEGCALILQREKQGVVVGVWPCRQDAGS